MHWSCMTAIWRSCVSFHTGVLVFASVREGTSAGKLTMKQLCMHHSNTCYRLSMRLLWALRSSQADKLLFPQEWLTTSAVWFMQIQQLDLDCNGNQEVISTNRKKSSCYLRLTFKVRWLLKNYYSIFKKNFLGGGTFIKKSPCCAVYYNIYL